MTPQTPIARHRTDWAQVVTDLRRHGGYTYADVAKEARVSKQSIRSWKDGHEPLHDAGHRLLTLWVKTTGKSYAERPMVWG